MGRGSPRRGSREIETQNRDKIVTLIGYIKTHNPYFPLWKSIQHIYETPEILRSMIFSTVSCLESDNDVGTSNSCAHIVERDFYGISNYFFFGASSVACYVRITTPLKKIRSNCT